MKKAVIIALVAVGSSFAVYAGISQAGAKADKAQTECCDKDDDCCPAGTKDKC